MAAPNTYKNPKTLSQEDFADVTDPEYYDHANIMAQYSRDNKIR